MRRVLTTIAAIVVAVGLGLWQGPRADSAAHVGQLSGGKDPGCTYSGYKNNPCKDYDSNCTGGQSFIAQNGDGTSHQRDGENTHSSGKCWGNKDCPTAITTWALTTYGCEDG